MIEIIMLAFISVMLLVACFIEISFNKKRAEAVKKAEIALAEFLAGEEAAQEEE